jgi:hypothetical protein
MQSDTGSVYHDFGSRGVKKKSRIPDPEHCPCGTGIVPLRHRWRVCLRLPKAVALPMPALAPVTATILPSSLAEDVQRGPCTQCQPVTYSFSSRCTSYCTNQCCGSKTIFSDPDPIFRLVLDPEPTWLVKSFGSDPKHSLFHNANDLNGFL